MKIMKFRQKSPQNISLKEVLRAFRFEYVSEIYSLGF